MSLVGNPALNDADAIIGYFSLKAAKERVHLPNGQKEHIPVVEIVALARDLGVRGQKYGGKLLLGALNIAYEVSLQIGVAGLFLNYTKQGKQLYEKFGFYEFKLAGNEKTMFLPIDSIKIILGKG